MSKTYVKSFSVSMDGQRDGWVGLPEFREPLYSVQLDMIMNRAALERFYEAMEREVPGFIRPHNPAYRALPVTSKALPAAPIEAGLEEP